MNTDPRKNILTGLLLAAALGANLFLLTPANIYLGNSSEFITPLNQLLAWWVIPATATLLLVMVTGLLIPARLYPRYLLILATVNLLIWFQGNLLVWHYGPLDGRIIDWSSQQWRGWVDSSIWAITLIAGLAFHRKLYRPLTAAALVLFAAQAVPVIYTGITQDRGNVLATDLSAQEETLHQLAGYSSEQNVLHIVFDGFQSDFFNELIQHPAIGEQYQEAFSGFTFYRETLGIFPFTRFAVPAFLSGKIYTNHKPKNEFIREAIAGNSIFNVATAAGMEVDLAGEAYWAPLYESAEHKNSYLIKEGGRATAVELRLRDTGTLLDLALFRVAPHFLKQYVYNDQRWLITRQQVAGEHLQFRYFSHTQFLNGLIENMRTDRATPVYKYIHIHTTHNPMVVDNQCNYVGGAIPTNRTNLLYQSRCTMDTAVKFFERMKTLGIYDNTTIIMHADHGGWVPHAGYQPELVNQYDRIPSAGVSLGSPLLLVKPAASQGKLIISDAPASLIDIPGTIAGLMSWPAEFGGRSLFDLKEDEERARPFYLYQWQRDAWTAEYTGPIQEYEITGKHYASAWVPKRRFKAPE